MTLSPPGWYPDPAPPAPGSPLLLRFWDGQHWTWQVAPAPAAAPYAGPAAGIAFAADEPATPDGAPLASWWVRAAAYLIDSVLVGAVSSVFTIPLQLGLQRDMQQLIRSEPTPQEFLSAYVDIFLPMITWTGLIGLVVWAFYSALMLRLKGATIGKMALGLAVRLRDRPGQLPWSTIARRVLTQYGYMLSALVPWVYLALFWYPWLDGLWAAADSRRQALHDKAARTNVVRTR